MKIKSTVGKKINTKQFRFKLDPSSIDEAGHFTGYASIFGTVDSYGDIVDKGAFKKTIKERKRFKLLWSHDAFAPGIGYVELEEDDKGLHVTNGQLYLDIVRAREAYINMKNETLDGLSIGYNTIKETVDRATEERHLKEVALWEVSLCNFQACPGAVVADVKGILDHLCDDIEGLKEVEITPGQRAELTKHIESLIALQANSEPSSDTPKAEEPPEDSVADEVIREAKGWRDCLATLLQ